MSGSENEASCDPHRAEDGSPAHSAGASLAAVQPPAPLLHCFCMRCCEMRRESLCCSCCICSCAHLHAARSGLRSSRGAKVPALGRCSAGRRPPQRAPAPRGSPLWTWREPSLMGESQTVTSLLPCRDSAVAGRRAFALLNTAAGLKSAVFG